MTGAEGKLFTPLAFTKTFVLIAAVFVSLTLVPLVLLHTIIARRNGSRSIPLASPASRWPSAEQSACSLSLILGWTVVAVAMLMLALFGLIRAYPDRLPEHIRGRRIASWHHRRGLPRGLASHRRVDASRSRACIRAQSDPGPAAHRRRRGLFRVFERQYEPILRWALANRGAFLSIPADPRGLLGLTVWLGFDRLAGVVPTAAERIGLSAERIRTARPYVALNHAFPGLGPRVHACARRRLVSLDADADAACVDGRGARGDADPEPGVRRDSGGRDGCRKDRSGGNGARSGTDLDVRNGHHVRTRSTASTSAGASFASHTIAGTRPSTAMSTVNWCPDRRDVRTVSGVTTSPLRVTSGPRSFAQAPFPDRRQRRGSSRSRRVR
jgi:hypothetical protein